VCVDGSAFDSFDVFDSLRESGFRCNLRTMRTIPECPSCRGREVRRTRREGLTDRLLSIIYMYPFRCDRCRHRYRAMRWGKRYPKNVSV